MKQSVKILLVEDDPSMLHGMSDLLQFTQMQYQLTTYTATNGVEALELVAKHTPDLIVSDIMMPKMDGLEFLSRVRANPNWFNIPFIFLTAKSEKQEIFEGHEVGADLYITKPFNSSELIELIKTQLDRSFKIEQTHKQDMENLKKSILQILNHELRTPLTYVTAYYEMLADIVAGSQELPDVSEYLRGIQAGCVRLTRLLEDFIIVIDLRTNEAQAKIRENSQLIVDPIILLRQTIALYEQQAAKKNIALKLKAPAQLPSIFGDTDSLLQVFSRLLDNAIKFSDGRRNGGCEIQIEVTAVNSTLNIAFQDQGQGLPESAHARIFEMFYQYNRSIQEQQGAGLGLTIARGLVECHNGRLSVQSKDGAGCTFTVSLPIANKSAPETMTIPSEDGRLRANVLVVEDDIYLLNGLKELLSLPETPYDINVFTATDGLAGLEIVKSHPINLIVSDIMMKPMNGLEFLDEVRQNQEWLEIPFIFLTARVEEADKHKGWSRGIQMYITKPYNSDELLNYVKIMLDRHFQGKAIIKQSFEELKSSILDLISPEFLTPLDSVATYSNQLATNVNPQTEQIAAAQDDTMLRNALAGIKEGSDRLTQFIEDFIALAELRTGETATAFRTRAQIITEPRWMLTELFEQHRVNANTRGDEVYIDIDTSLPAFYGDSQHITAAIKRLLRYLSQVADDEEKKEKFVAVTAVDGALLISLRIPTPLPTDTFDHLHKILVDGEEPKTNRSEHDPSLQVVFGYCSLHKCEISLENDPQTGLTIRMALPTTDKTNGQLSNGSITN